MLKIGQLTDEFCTEQMKKKSSVKNRFNSGTTPITNVFFNFCANHGLPEVSEKLQQTGQKSIRKYKDII